MSRIKYGAGVDLDSSGVYLGLCPAWNFPEISVDLQEVGVAFLDCHAGLDPASRLLKN